MPTIYTRNNETTVVPVAQGYERMKGAFKLSKDTVHVTVGDPQKEDFVPKATSIVGENSRMMVPMAEILIGRRRQQTLGEQDYLDWLTQRFYELPVSDALPEGGYEIDVVFSEKPLTNIVSMDIDAHGLDSVYQEDPIKNRWEMVQFAARKQLVMTQTIRS